MCLSCTMAGRCDLVERLNILNLHSMQPDEEGANQQAAKTATLIDRMGITPEQQHVIATGSAMYMQLLEAVMQERQRLQSQFADLDAINQASSSNASSNSISSMELRADLAAGRQEQLEAQRKQVARLRLLMQKEFILRMAGMTWFLGCLSWKQLSKAVVLCWPFTLRPSLLATEIQKRYEQERLSPKQGKRSASEPSVRN